MRRAAGGGALLMVVGLLSVWGLGRQDTGPPIPPRSGEAEPTAHEAGTPNDEPPSDDDPRGAFVPATVQERGLFFPTDRLMPRIRDRSPRTEAYILADSLERAEPGLLREGDPRVPWQEIAERRKERLATSSTLVPGKQIQKALTRIRFVSISMDPPGMRAPSQAEIDLMLLDRHSITDPAAYAAAGAEACALCEVDRSSPVEEVRTIAGRCVRWCDALLEGAPWPDEPTTPYD